MSPAGIDAMSNPLPPTRRSPASVCAAQAIACGLVMTVIAYLDAWQQAQGNYILFSDRHLAVLEMQNITTALDAYRIAHSAWPESIDELPRDFAYPIQLPATGPLLDPWGHGFVYRADDNDFELSSLGQDGKPGGDGLDADLPFHPHKQWSASATLWQFTFDMPTRGFKLASLISGVATAVLCWMMLRETQLRSLPARVLAWTVTLGMALMMAWTMTALHIPSGH